MNGRQRLNLSMVSNFPTKFDGYRYPDAIEYKKKLCQQIEELGVSAHVRFLEHSIDHARVAELFQTSDVAVSIPVEDGFPATILEAMACGTPLVVSNLRDYDGVVDNSHAMRIAPLDEAGLLNAIILLLTESETRLRGGQQN